MESITFRRYNESDFDACVHIFDANCPDFFAPNEREDYIAFLGVVEEHNQVCLMADRVCGAFAILNEDSDKRLNWITIHPEYHGIGLGSAIIHCAISLARESSANHLLIAASHKSSPFFTKFGAIPIKTTPDGWGPGMHRIDMQLKVSLSQP